MTATLKTNEQIAVIVEKVSNLLKDEAKAWMVGGCVRDLVLGREPADLDLVISGSEDVVHSLASELKAVLVELSGPFSMYRLVMPDLPTECYIDIEIMKEGDILANLARRDFTVDAMALPLNPQGIRVEELIDPWGGQVDIEARVIRAVSPRVFEEDPVRALRAFRLAASLGFTIDPQTVHYIRTMKRGFHTVAGERLWREFRAVLTLKRASRVLKEMEGQAALLSSLIPELASLKVVGKGKRHVLDAWDHSILALEVLEEILHPGQQERLARVRVLFNNAAVCDFNHDWRPVLKLGVLLHDSGKPAVVDLGGEGPQFPGHEKASLVIAGNVCERWRLPAWERRVVESVVGGHMHPLYLYLSNGGSISGKRRFVHKYKEHAALVLISSLADVIATRRAAGDERGEEAYGEFVCDFLSFLIEEGKNWQKLPRFMDGSRVMNILDIGPSPEVGRVLKLVAEKEIEGEITSEEEAAEFVRSLCKKDFST